MIFAVTLPAKGRISDPAVVATFTGSLHPARVAQAREWSADGFLRVTVGSAPMVERAPSSWGHAGPRKTEEKLPPQFFLRNETFG